MCIRRIESHIVKNSGEQFLPFHYFAAATAKSHQSCLTLCDPIEGSPPGSAIPGILQARTLEWVAISFSNAWKWKVKGESLSCVWLLATPWTAAYQAPPSMGFSRQEYWSGVPLPSPLVYRQGNWGRKVKVGGCSRVLFLVSDTPVLFASKLIFLQLKNEGLLQGWFWPKSDESGKAWLC